MLFLFRLDLSLHNVRKKFGILNYATKQVTSWSAKPSACNATIRPQAAVNASTDDTGVCCMHALQPLAAAPWRRGLGGDQVVRACGLWAKALELSQVCTDGAENVGALCCCLLVKINSLWGLL